MADPVLNPSFFLSPEVRVVEASAGSGKTYALAKRYVQLILNPDAAFDPFPVRGVLALTFTNKAAFEMKIRILEFLKRIALGQLSKTQEQDILGSVRLDANEASVKAFAVMEGIIRQYNFFQVQTIDKFINALLSGCAFKIGLTANFRIKTNSGEYLERSLDGLIDRARTDQGLREDFERFLHHYIYLENRSGWFPKEDILLVLTALFAQNNTYGRAFLKGPFAPDQVVKKKAAVLQKIKALRPQLPVGTHATFLKSLDKFLVKHDRVFDIDALSEYFAREDAPMNKGTEMAPETDRLWGEIHDDLENLCFMEASSLFNPYIDIFEQAMAGFYELAAKDDCLFLSELNKRAGLLFDADHMTVEELYYRMATRFHHYLIDEFQDTSRLQWYNLEAMAEEALSTGGTLFYVGDRKQAIYSFRGGDERLFDDVKERFGAFNVRVDWLTNNWRSQKEIVDFNNAIFSMDNLTRFIIEKQADDEARKMKVRVHWEDQDFIRLKNIFGSSRQTYQEENSGGRVVMDYVDVDGKESCDRVIRERVTALLRDLSTRFSYRDIAILTRGNAQVKDITNWLLEEGIPVESDRTSDVKENRLIREIIAFLKFLDSPIDNLAFTTFILGEVFAGATGLDRRELSHFVMRLRRRLAEEGELYVYTEFRKNYPRAWGSFIDEFFRNVGFYPLYELVVTVYRRFKVFEHDAEQGFFMHFLELVKASEEEYPDITSFLDYFENLQGEALYVHVTDTDAVKILTVHKAKGLEFPVVILPYLGLDIQVGSSNGEYQPSYILRPQEEGLELLRVKSKYLKFSEKLYRIHAREYKKAFFSELNTVYVALTRAKNELYGFIPKKIGQSFNCAKFLIPEGRDIRGEARNYEPTKTKDVAIVRIPPPDYPDWIHYLRDEFSQADQLRGRLAKMKGEVVHSLLSGVSDLSCGQRTAMVREAIVQARARFPAIQDWSNYQCQVEALIDHPSMNMFFYCDGALVFTEREIVNAAGHTKRCDRLIVRADEVWVIDFKSASNPQGRYAEQVREYLEILKDIYPRRAVKGFLIYLETMDVEEVHG